MSSSSPTKRPHYVGTLPEDAIRTRPRRMGAPTHFGAGHATPPTGAPIARFRYRRSRGSSSSTPFGAAENGTGRGGSGRSTHRAPTDLLAYQELIYRLRPDWIVDTRTGAGGLALFLASICDLVGNGRVLSIDDYPPARPAEHPRITYLREPADQRAHCG